MKTEDSEFQDMPGELPADKKGSNAQLVAFNEIVSILTSIDRDGQEHILRSVCNWLGHSFENTAIAKTSEPKQIQGVAESVFPGFDKKSDLSAKEFLLDKDPQNNLERVASLAYYLTHYRDTPHFKTNHITQLNSEAAQPKFGNPSDAVENATKSGFLVSSSKGNKQISAMGEQFIIALPDRDRAADILKRMRSKKKKPRGQSKPYE